MPYVADFMQQDKSRQVLSKILADFLVGGFLISAAVYIAEILGPVFGGSFAALPVRVGGTIFLAGTSGGSSMAYSMAVGALSGSLGAFVFSVVLSLAPQKIGIFRSFFLAVTLCGLLVYLSSPIISGALS